MGELEPVIHLTKACNHRCLFCSRKGDPPESAAEIRKILHTFKDTVTFEGGEPTLAKNLQIWARRAKSEGVREVMLVTNGYSLDKPENVSRLISAGVDVFNFNFPSHIEKLYNLITGSVNYKKTVAAIKNCLAVAGPEKTRLTFVLNSLNYRHLPAYARFIKREFGRIFYAEINMIKVLGSVKKRTWLVPQLSDAASHLRSGFSEFEKQGLNFISDGIPLCFMKGFEHKNIDAWMSIKGGCFSMKEKTHCPVCISCALKELCPGPRKDYAALYGCSELRPVKSKNRAAFIVKKLLR